MKKFLLTTIASVLIAGSVFAQQTARECVLIEAFTGIGCGYCPAAANGIAQMMEEGLAIAPLAFHNSAYSPPQYATTETNARASFYNVNSFPTVLIDGVNRIEGGGVASQSMYGQYKPYYDQRINVPSPYTIDLTFGYDSGTECYAKAIVNKVGDCSSDKVKLYIALTESHIQQSWQGLQELNAVVRDMVTTTAGVEITQYSQEVKALFSVAGYKKENCSLIAWVQSDSSPKEVFQAVKLNIGEAAPVYDLGITSVEDVPTESCSGRITPRMKFRNYGEQAISSVTFNITNGAGEQLGSVDWTGNLLKGQEQELIFEEIIFGETGSVKIEAVNLNGSNEDDYTYDNTYLFNAIAPYELPNGYMKIQVKTGDDPENFSIEIKNMETGEVFENLTFEEANKIYQEEVTLEEYGCYRITVKNSAGNGISGNGFWGIKNEDNETVVMGGNNVNVFRYEFPIEITYSNVGIEAVEIVDEVNVYPNPASSVINVSSTNLSKVDVYNTFGQLIYSQDADSEIVEISTNSWANGLYFVNVETKDGVKSSQKVVVNK